MYRGRRETLLLHILTSLMRCACGFPLSVTDCGMGSFQRENKCRHDFACVPPRICELWCRVPSSPKNGSGLYQCICRYYPHVPPHTSARPLTTLQCGLHMAFAQPLLPSSFSQLLPFNLVYDTPWPPPTSPYSFADPFAVTIVSLHPFFDQVSSSASLHNLLHSYCTQTYPAPFTPNLFPLR